jgi:hypothetical protein
MSDKTGRPSIYTEELAQRICNELAEGNSLHMICATDWAPHISTVMAWRLDDTKRIGAESFSEHYARAREAQGDVYADKVGTLGYAVADGQIPPDAARVAIDAFKWTAGKQKPKVYGDKIVQEQTGANGGPIAMAISWAEPSENK